VDDGASGLRESPVSSAVALAEGFRSLTGAILPGLRPFTWHRSTVSGWLRLRRQHALYIGGHQYHSIATLLQMRKNILLCHARSATTADQGTRMTRGRAHLAVLVLSSQLIPDAAVDAAASLLLRQPAGLILQQPPASCTCCELARRSHRHPRQWQPSTARCLHQAHSVTMPRVFQARFEPKRESIRSSLHALMCLLCCRCKTTSTRTK